MATEKKRTLDDLQRDDGLVFRGPGSVGSGDMFNTAYSPMGGFGAQSPFGSPLSMGQAIGGIASGQQMPGMGYNAVNDQSGGAFGQMRGGLGGGAADMGNAIAGGGDWKDKVSHFLGWDEMDGPERAWLLSQGIGAVAGGISAYKQGKQEDEERKKRQRSAEALRPYIQSLMQNVGS